MLKRLNAQFDQLDALSLRERLLVFVCLLACIYFFAEMTLLSPMAKSAKQHRFQAQVAQEQVTALQDQIQIMQAKIHHQPSRHLQSQHGKLKADLARLNRHIAVTAKDLVPPHKMVQVLEALLAKKQGLKLQHLTSLPSQPLAIDTPAETVDQPLLYEHGIELVFTGDYFDTLNYLQALEQLPWQLFWDSIDYHVNQYPKATVRLRLHTLNQQAGWLRA